MEIPDWCLGVERHAGIVEYPFWPSGWNADDVWWDCETHWGGHHWELAYGGPPGRGEHVVRCKVCHVPRCGHSNEKDPCMRRRHHPASGSPFQSGHLPFSHWSPDLTDVDELRKWLDA